MRKSFPLAAISVGVMIGFSVGLVVSLETIAANRYFQYGLFRLLATVVLSNLATSIFYAVLVCLAGYMLWVLLAVRLGLPESRVRRIGLIAALDISVVVSLNWILRVLTLAPLSSTARWLLAKWGIWRAPGASVYVPSEVLTDAVLPLIVLAALIVAMPFLYRLLGKADWKRFVKTVSTGRAAGTATFLIVVLAGLNISLLFHGKMITRGVPNIVLVYFDALRADHLGCYGYGRDVSPTIDRLAQEGALVRSVISQAPGTYPSVHAALTSKYACHFTQESNTALGRKHLTAAEILKNRGYHTIAVSSSPIVRKAVTKYSLGGFEQGFDLFDESVCFGEEWNWQYRSPEGIIEKATSWLRDNHTKRFFLFLYIMDPHDEYLPPAPYDTLYGAGSDAAGWLKEGSPSRAQRRILRGKPVKLGDHHINQMVALYDGEIRYADAQLGRLVDLLRSLDLLDVTLIVVTSDHGEEFYEHGGLKHNYTLYNEVIKVPLVLRYPPLISPGTIVDTPLIQTIDMVPTILDIVGIRQPTDMEGVSLIEMMKGERSHLRDGALSEAPLVDAKALVTEEWKYIHHFEANVLIPNLAPKYLGGRELYNLIDDPDEQRNLYGASPERAIMLYNQMLDMLPDFEKRRIREGKVIPLDKKAEEQLKSLGYIQ